MLPPVTATPFSPSTLLRHTTTHHHATAKPNPFTILRPSPPLPTRHSTFLQIPSSTRRRSHFAICSANRRNLNNNNNGKISNKNFTLAEKGDDDGFGRRLTQVVLWAMEGVYILWLFLLPYAPGDPVWAISSDTINQLVGLSLNFCFVLPLANAVGVHVMEAPVLHPMSEALFNLVIGWTLMFAPLLFTDCKRYRYKGSLDVLWGLQMFLTNTFLIPYMAIRLNEDDEEENNPRTLSQLGAVMIKDAPTVGLISGAVCLLSILWGLYGRMDGDFGSVTDRWNFLLSYLGSERLAYAFIWDIVLYTVFQPWLIGENLDNIAENRVDLVKVLRYVPVVGLVTYLLCLDKEDVAKYGEEILE